MEDYDMQYDIHYDYKHIKNESISCIATIGDKEICNCKIYRKADQTNTWVIPAWFTEEGYKNQGIGTDILKHGLQNMAQIFGLPDHIEYIWNGLNQYVYDWLEKNFDAVCNCPLAVQKTQSDDDWSSHIYTLDKDKVLEFAGIEKEKDEREL